MSGTLKITTPSDREVAITRELDAPRQLVFDAFTKPELIRRWLLGPEGWTMTVCDVDLRPGGAYRYVWRKGENIQMGMGGVFLEVTPPEKIVSTEKFDDPWYTGEATGTVRFVERDGKTTVTTTMLYESKAARDQVLASPMEEGMAVGYDRLAALLATLPH